MRGIYDLKVKQGDTVKVETVHSHSVNTLTKNKEYKVFRVKLFFEGTSQEKQKFLIKTDTGLKKWYQMDNSMFEKVDKPNDAKRSLFGSEIYEGQIWEVKMPTEWGVFKIHKIRATNIESNLEYIVAVTFKNDKETFDENIKNIIGNPEFILKN